MTLEGKITTKEMLLAIETEVAKLPDNDRVLWMRYTASTNVRGFEGEEFRRLEWGANYKWERRLSSAQIVVFCSWESKKWNVWWGGRVLVGYTSNLKTVMAGAINAIREQWLPTVKTNHLIM